jgi:hypothetical protein
MVLTRASVARACVIMVAMSQCDSSAIGFWNAMCVSEESSATTGEVSHCLTREQCETYIPVMRDNGLDRGGGLRKA